MGQLLSGRYRVIRALGEGGMGKVYLAEHEAIEKRIALKVLHREYSANADVVERFKQEAISASRIKHPNVIDVFDFGQIEDGSCFIAMELLEGEDLGDALQKVGAFDPEQAIRIILQVSRALGAAHARGVVHRDLKPENVFLQNTPEGEQIVKIVDFGIAQLRKTEEVDEVQERKRRLTKTGMIFGTPEYMAPEQARGQAIDQRSDIYAAACILYELLSGSVPFSGPSFLEVLNHHVLTPVPPLRQQNPEVNVSTELEIVVLKGLAKQPADRFATMKEFAEALVQTPEGRNMRRSISSMSSLGEMSTSEVGRATMSSRGVGTEIHGSPRVGTPVVASQTVIGLELPRSSLTGVWLGVFATVALGAGLFVYFSSPGGPKPQPGAPVTASPSTAHTPVESPALRADPAPTPSVAIAPLESSTPPPVSTDVVIHVSTTPPGAVVLKDGFQVCDASPCDVLVEPGKGVTLSAKLGSKIGAAKVMAQREQSVTIALGGGGTRPQTPTQPSLCEVEVDGLKILRPCK